MRLGHERSRQYPDAQQEMIGNELDSVRKILESPRVECGYMSKTRLRVIVEYFLTFSSMLGWNSQSHRQRYQMKYRGKEKKTLNRKAARDSKRAIRNRKKRERASTGRSDDGDSWMITFSADDVALDTTGSLAHWTYLCWMMILHCTPCGL